MNSLRSIFLIAWFACSTFAQANAVVDSTDPTSKTTVSADQRARALIARSLMVMDTDPIRSHEHATNALKCAELAGDATLEHRTLRCLGQAEERMGAYADLLRTALRTLKLAQDLGNASFIATDLRDLSMAYALNEMPEKAVDEARNALAMVLPMQDATTIVESQLFLVRTLLVTGRYDEALRTAEKFRLSASMSNSKEDPRLAHLVARVLLATHKYADAFTYLARLERTLDGSDAERFQLATDIAEAYIGSGRVQEATDAIAFAQTLLPRADTWNNRNRIVELDYEMAVMQGHWELALSTFKHMTEQADSVNNARTRMQLARMQVTYDLERKEQDNTELRAENAMNAQLIQGTQWNNRFLLIFLLVLFGCVVGLFFTSRHGLRMARRLKLKNMVIKKQHDEIHAKNLEMQRQHLRLAETLVSDEEKEMVIKEIHHRVKNNLQVVDSLLTIQGMENEDPNVDRVLRAAQGRIRSMAMVHEHIYRSASRSDLDLRTHLHQLVRSILVAHGVHDRVSVSVEANVPPLPVETLMPLTLVVNELFTNSLKYAFCDGSMGRITVVVRPSGVGYELLFSDNGSGMGTDEPGAKDKSFGLELVRTLARQLNGEVHFLKGRGTTISMTFAPDRMALQAAS